jgi:hypothetical protein
MAKFTKGNTFGIKGRTPVDADLKAARKLTSLEAEKIINKYLNLSLEELQKAANDIRLNVHEILVARILYEAIKKGDHIKLDWIYNRLFGKPKELEYDKVNDEHRKAMADAVRIWSKVNPAQHFSLIRELKDKNNKS